MFRCPGCAKVYKMPLNQDYSLLANRNMDKFHVIKEPFYKDGNLARAFANMHEVKDIFDVAAFLHEKKSPAVQDAKCPSCGEVHTIQEWQDALENPMDYFDAENLCGCGGELWMDRIPFSNKYGMVCEKCEWVKPNVVVSGSGDASVK
jgi:hypothetical protein